MSRGGWRYTIHFHYLLPCRPACRLPPAVDGAETSAGSAALLLLNHQGVTVVLDVCQPKHRAGRCMCGLSYSRMRLFPSVQCLDEAANTVLPLYCIVRCGTRCEVQRHARHSAQSLPVLCVHCSVACVLQLTRTFRYQPVIAVVPRDHTTTNRSTSSRTHVLNQQRSVPSCSWRLTSTPHLQELALSQHQHPLTLGPSRVAHHSCRQFCLFSCHRPSPWMSSPAHLARHQERRHSHPSSCC